MNNFSARSWIKLSLSYSPQRYTLSIPFSVCTLSPHTIQLSHMLTLNLPHRIFLPTRKTFVVTPRHVSLLTLQCPRTPLSWSWSYRIRPHFDHHVFHSCIFQWGLFIKMATDWEVSEVGDTCRPAAGPGRGRSVQIEWISAGTAHLGFPALWSAPHLLSREIKMNRPHSILIPFSLALWHTLVPRQFPHFF